MLANLPHVSAEFERPRHQQKEQQKQEETTPSSALFLLDSGAGGVEVMLHARAAQELQIHSAPHVRTHTLKVCAIPVTLVSWAVRLTCHTKGQPKCACRFRRAQSEGASNMWHTRTFAQYVFSEPG